MKWKLAFALAATVLSSVPALATTFYEFDLQGERTLQYRQYSCGRFVCPPNFTTSWTGNLILGVESNADGIYTGSSVPLVKLTSDLVSFTTDGYGTGGESVLAAEPAFTIGIQGGVVTSIEGDYWLYSGSLGRDLGTIFRGGLSVSGYDFRMNPYWTGEARLSVRPIPEPNNFALLLGGLSLVGAVVGRRRYKSVTR